MPAPDRYITDPTNSSSGEQFFAITPSNTVDFPKTVRGIYVGANGNITAVNEAEVAVTFSNCVAGSIIPIRAIRVNSTGTTATNLVGLY